MRVLVIIGAFCLAACTATEKKVVCYWGSWSVYRPGPGKFEIENIDPFVCTHLIYTFVGIEDAGGIKVLDPWQDLPDNWGKDGFGRFNKLKLKNPALKTLVAIGGWNEGSEKYSKVASDPVIRERFAENAVAFVKKWGFDGFDLDWEYPGQRGGAPSDVKNFVELVKILSQKLHSQGLLLSAAVAAAESSASQSYDIAAISKYLDSIHLMAYDFHGSWETTTGFNAPLHPRQSDSYNARGLNTEAAVKYWLSKGAPKEKLILGVPTYGRGFTLSNPNSNGIGATASGPGTAGPYTREAGMLGYNEICEMHKNDEWKVFYDKETDVPWCYKGNQWVGFDNVKSIEAKAKFALEAGLGGVMVWSIETDDFRGVCGEKYPLIKTLNAVMRDGKKVTEGGPSTRTTISESSIGTRTTGTGTTGEDNSTSGTGSPAPPSPTPTGLCKEEGLLAHPRSCNFSKCTNDGQGGFIEHTMLCPEHLCFDPDAMICNWPKQNS